jgi:hypothetical protein
MALFNEKQLEEKEQPKKIVQLSSMKKRYNLRIVRNQIQ